MYVTKKRCIHLYTNILYSKHCLHWIQISCHSQHSLTHTAADQPILQFSNRRSFNCFRL